MTIKNFYLLIFLGLSSQGFSQKPITNEKTAKHVLISGTSTLIIPPAGFEKANSFLGFQDAASGSSIIINEVPAAYGQLKEAFSKENMAKKGMELLSAEEYFLNGKPAILIYSKQFSPAHGYHFLKSTLVAGFGTNSTLLINSNVPEAQQEKLGESVKSSLLSVLKDMQITVSPFSSIDFEVDLKQSSFKLVESISGSLELEGPGKEFLMIAKSIRTLNPSDMKGSSINALKAITTIEYVDLISSKEISQDGMTGYQVAANVIVKKNRQPMKAVQAVLFSDNSYYVFLTILNPGNEQLVNDVEQILRSFKRK